MQSHQNKLQAEDIAEQATHARLKEGLEMKNKYYTPNVLNEMVLESISDIYQSKYLNNVKVTTIGDGSNDNTTDVAGQIIGQMMNTFNTLEDQMNSAGQATAKKAIAAAKKWWEIDLTTVNKRINITQNVFQTIGFERQQSF